MKTQKPGKLLKLKKRYRFISIRSDSGFEEIDDHGDIKIVFEKVLIDYNREYGDRSVTETERVSDDDFQILYEEDSDKHRLKDKVKNKNLKENK